MPRITRRLLLAATAATGFGAARRAAAEPLPAQIDVGALLPLTGPGAYLGEQMQRGIGLFLDGYERRRDGEGLPKINVIFVDSQADPRVGFQGYQLLSGRQHPRLMFLTMTNVAKAVAPQAIRDGTAMVNMTQGPVTELGANFTSVVPAYTSQAEIVLKAARDLGVKSLAVIYDNQEASLVLSRLINRQIAPRLGLAVATVQQVPFGATEVGAQVSATLETKPDGIFVVALTPVIATIGAELKTQGYGGRLFSTADMRDVVNAGHGDAVEGAIYPNFWFDPDNADTRALDAGYRQKYGDAVPQWAEIAFKVGQIIEAALLSLKAQNRPWSGDDFIAAQKQLSIETVSGHTAFLPDGRIIEPMTLVQVKGGEPVVLRQVSADEMRPA